MTERDHSTLVTGIGLVTAAGVGLEENWRNFKDLRSGIRRIERYELPPKYRTDFAGLLDPLPETILHPGLRSRLNDEDLRQEYVKTAAAVVFEALKDAGALERLGQDGKRTVLFVASSLGNYLHVAELVKDYFIKALSKITSLVHGMNSYLPARLASIFEVSGPNGFISSSCTSSLQAIRQGDLLLRTGAADRVIVCGIDLCLETGTFHLWNKLRVLSKRNESPAEACRPYCRERDGMVLAEAAGCFVLEREGTHVRPPWARFLGYGAACGALDFLKPTPEYLERCAVDAVKDSGVSEETIDFVAGGASGSPFCDHLDGIALTRALGEEHGRQVPLFSFKSHLGTTFGTQAVSEGALALCCLAAEHVPQVRNLTEPDPLVTANVNYDHREYAGREMRNMLFLNYGFAGHHMAVVYGRGEREIGNA